ncbi:MAG TPA: bifunctional 2-C-methyl-D-erythritol 4-phosphate cytidylyltransferase/2-C-methyl-D-erythritol 2,4-cyclodiphosphate synthase [Firmicutes bacterium]|jgi:2-C-methyl-D-erythritol 2,4-cyclodiphosphate synthase/2-C-methyl-D-erythritol 4-phosphate cytidylyltransferase|nr:bifunctional 2-C-methyl-D-erythritol 4-phosphate cytidylyltransferase/2-C-methyl-D-erythritol 2,4-cyclodiphosphate synthase [Bacillota bacterium]
MNGLLNWQAVAIIPAAGSGRRMRVNGNQEKQKLMLVLEGETIFLRSIKALDIPEIEAFFIPVAAAERREFSRQIKESFPNREVYLCAGGKERQDSIYSALVLVGAWQGWRVPEERRLILIHDAARPLIEKDLIQEALSVASQTGAAGVGVPVKDTIKIVGRDRVITATPERSNLWAIQTPQVFTWPVLWTAYSTAKVEGETGTDDASLVERTGWPVQMVTGSYRNIKITTPEDLIMAQALLRSSSSQPPLGRNKINKLEVDVERQTSKCFQSKEEKTMLRVGQGFDVHKLVSGRRLVLGGVEIPSELGLEGHSDADALIHAVIDALLGATGEGDIGELFPDTDPVYQGIDSQLLLRKVMDRLKGAGVKPINIDATVIAQYPKIAPYRQEMRENLATLLGLSLKEINIKATTTEKLGFTGRKEGIAVQVVALVQLSSSCSLV